MGSGAPSGPIFSRFVIVPADRKRKPALAPCTLIDGDILRVGDKTLLVDIIKRCDRSWGFRTLRNRFGFCGGFRFGLLRFGRRGSGGVGSRVRRRGFLGDLGACGGTANGQKDDRRRQARAKRTRLDFFIIRFILSFLTGTLKHQPMSYNLLTNHISMSSRKNTNLLLNIRLIIHFSAGNQEKFYEKPVGKYEKVIAFLPRKSKNP